MTPGAARPTASTLAVGLGATYLLTFIGLLVSDHRMVELGRPDLRGFQSVTWVIAAGILSATVVGIALARDRPRHPVGWLFLALAGSILVSGVLDTYADHGLLARPGSLPGASTVAVVGDSSWIPWLVVVALVLHLTPTGQHLGRRWALAARATVVAGVVAFSASMVSARDLEAPYQQIQNPWALSAGVRAWTDPVGQVAIIGVGVGLIAGAASLLVRFRRSSGIQRRQLLWLAAAAVPLPAFVVVAFVASATGHSGATLLATGGFVVLVPVAAGLSVSQFHLYEVERLLAVTVKYTVLSLLLLLTYGLVVLMAVRGLGQWSASPQFSSTLGALAAAAVTAPLRTWLQTQLDRRFNRRQYDATRVVRRGLADERAGADVQQLLRQAFGDASLTIAYPGSVPGSWLTMEGFAPSAAAATVEVTRKARVVARIGFDPSVVDAETVTEASASAAAELDNVRLRAELSRQVAEVSDSRRRLAGAQRRERRRIERDLHDGAQQSLLALAFDLQAAQVNGDAVRMRQALATGAESARSAVRELRELANGLHPAALADGGLAAALDDLSRHSPVPLRVRATAPRLDPALEFTAWLVACEAIVNAQKHARAAGIDVDTTVEQGTLLLRVSDDGQGGANPDGPGLRSIRDRTEAARGTLTVVSEPGRGTRIDVRLPCG